MTTFSVVTYNIDGREYNITERISTFLSYVKNHPVDIVFVQECQRIINEKLLREMRGLGYSYYMASEMRERPIDSSEVIFSKIPLKNTRYIPFPNSKQQRGLSLADLDFQEKKCGIITLITSQFETGDANLPSRREQIRFFNVALRNINNPIIFGGDTGLLEYNSSVGTFIPNGWEDAWYAAGSSDNKFTLDSNNNTLAAAPYCDRPDRVWYIDSSKKLECNDCVLYGNDSTVVISSHYGVRCDFEL